MVKKGLLIIILLVGAFYFGSSIADRSPDEGQIIVTRVPVENQIVVHHGLKTKSDLGQSQIISFHPDDPGKSLNILTEGFHSAVSPELSQDNRKIVFAGKKQKEDSWQIWQLDLQKHKFDQITSQSMDCFDPVFLPDQRVLFSCSDEDGEQPDIISLYTAEPGASDITPLTFHPHANYSATVLHDGRIMFLSEQVQPENGKVKLLGIRPDGTNAGLFYKMLDDHSIVSKAREDASRQIYFSAQHSKEGGESSLLRFSYNNPFAALDTLYISEMGSIQSVYPQKNEKLVLSYRKSTNETFGIYSYQEGEDQPSPLFTDGDFHLIDPVTVGEKPFIPKKLPTALNFELNTGITVFVESDETIINSEPSEHLFVQVLGIDGILKEFPPADDGSFYLQVEAKMPFRYQLIDGEDNIIRGPSPWFWVMPGERRGFTGWDEKQLITPTNRVPESINNSAVEIWGKGTAAYADNGDDSVWKEEVYEK